MPFVQRNKQGEVIGLFANRQWDGQEELPDGSPEVERFQERHPIPADLLRPRTREELEQFRKKNEELDAEYRELQSAILALARAWSQLELALSNLLYELLNLPSKASRLAHTVYFSPTSLDARMTMVGNLVARYVEENKAVPELSGLMPLWDNMDEPHFKSARTVRNAMAHGCAQKFQWRGEMYVRLMSPAFDVIRVWKKFDEGKIPGLSVKQVSSSVRKVNHLELCVDEVNRIIVASRDEPEALPAIFDELKARLAQLASL
jgi:hypothetical protein